ncbi:MAG: hypothetical protein PHP01_04285 [Phycisphaerae bacterium]|nr:hypothetical protein [Phycisphaerae bacterium]
MENNSIKHIGRAKTVLVAQQSPDSAVISEIIVKIIPNTGPERIHFAGLVEFSDNTKNHICNNILALIDRITAAVGMYPLSYEISAVNPDIASRFDTAVEVNGFSADLSVFVAMLSAALQIPVSNNILMTGNIASVEGDIGPVGSVQAKLKAALEDKSIDCLIYPKANTIEKTFDRDTLSISEVGNIEDLVKLVFREKDIVEASLEVGFFENSIKIAGPEETVMMTALYFVCDNNNRFWQMLRKHLFTDNFEKARELLEVFTSYYIRKMVYPAYFGDRLFSLICVTPPAVRRIPDLFPLLDTGRCIHLAGFAESDQDYEDVYKMLDANRGKVTQYIVRPNTYSSSMEDLPDRDNNIFDMVVAKINELAIAENFGVRIDSARASFILNSVTIGSYEEFLETITSFYIHLRCYENSEPVKSINQQRSRNEAVELLENTFRNNGGIETALQRASDGTVGGMRKILDEMTDFYKLSQQQKHITAIFRQSVDSLCWNERVEFMRHAMERLKNFMPQEIKDEPPERFARDYEAIIKAYVNGMDKFNQLLRRF